MTLSPRLLLGLGLTAAALLATLTVDPTAAHEGEDHGAAPTATARAGDLLTVSKPAQFLLGIRTEPARTEPVAEAIRLQGTLTAPADGEALVSSPQPGRLVGGGFPAVGQSVRRGQVLATVEGSRSAAERLALELERADAEAELAQARADVTRLRALVRVVARKEIDAAEIRLTAAEARLAAIRSAAGVGNRFPLVAPTDGVLAEATATLGAQVEPGQTLFRIVDLRKLTVTAQVFEADLARLRGATTVRVSVPGDSALDGRFIGLGGALDPGSRTTPALFEVTNRTGTLRVGQLAEVVVPTGAATAQIVVPEAALVRDGPAAAVFVHTAPEGFVRRPVSLGPGQPGGRVALRSGLRPGDRVVTLGAAQLQAAR